MPIRRFIPVALATTLAVVAALPRAASADLGETLAMRDRIKTFLTSVIEHGWNGIEVETEGEITTGSSDAAALLGLPEAVARLPGGWSLQLAPTKLYVGVGSSGEKISHVNILPRDDLIVRTDQSKIYGSLNLYNGIVILFGIEDLNKPYFEIYLQDVAIDLQEFKTTVGFDLQIRLNLVTDYETSTEPVVNVEFEASRVSVISDVETGWQPAYLDWVELELRLPYSVVAAYFGADHLPDNPFRSILADRYNAGTHLKFEAWNAMVGDLLVDRIEGGLALFPSGDMVTVVNLLEMWSADTEIGGFAVLNLDPDTLAVRGGFAGAMARGVEKSRPYLVRWGLKPALVEALLAALEASAERPCPPGAEFDRYMVEIPGDGRLLVNGEDLMPLYRQHLSEAEAR